MGLPVTIFEAEDSRDDLTYGANGGGVTIRYYVTGYDNEVDAFDLGLLTSPPVYLGFIRNQISPKRVGKGLYKIEVPYGTKGIGGGDQPVGTTPTTPTEPGGGGGGSGSVPLGPGYNFDITGGTIKITQSRGTLFAEKRGGGTPPDFKQAIGVSRDRIEGCEIPDQVIDWGRTVARDVVTLDYIKTLAGIRGFKNQDTFYGFAPGDVMYLGATGRFTDNDKWSVDHKFRTILGKEMIDICDGLSIGPKRGHDYLWVLYEDEVVSDRVGALPIAAYIEDVIEDADFNLIEITG